VFEENCLDSTPYHGGWGLVNWYGIPKPSFRAFEMLHEAGGHSLKVAGEKLGTWEPEDNNYASVMIDVRVFFLPLFALASD
jgi:xylan 1,4-beta-xylosidase